NIMPNKEGRQEPALQELSNTEKEVRHSLTYFNSWWLKAALQHGGNPNLLDPVEFLHPNQSLLSAAVLSHNAENVQVLIDAGADLNHQDGGGYTAVMTGAGCREYQIIEQMLLLGADYTLETEHGTTLASDCFMFPIPDKAQFPEKAAAYERVMRFLEQHGVDMEAAKRRAEWRGEPFPK
ncbi:MAG: hypothetical protein R3C01_12905, partial [Planctomycetaceae bacterium]